VATPPFFVCLLSPPHFLSDIYFRATIPPLPDSPGIPPGFPIHLFLFRGDLLQIQRFLDHGQVILMINFCSRSFFLTCANPHILLCPNFSLGFTLFVIPIPPFRNRTHVMSICGADATAFPLHVFPPPGRIQLTSSFISGVSRPSECCLFQMLNRPRVFSVLLKPNLL